MRLNKGDQVVVSKLDYPNMMNAWKQREMRDGIVLKWVELDLPKMTNHEIVKAFSDQITGRCESGSYHAYDQLERSTFFRPERSQTLRINTGHKW
jgi:hypothetical protein